MEVVRGVGVEAEIAGEQIGVGIVVILAAAQAAFEAERSEPRARGAQIERGHVARDFGNPIAVDRMRAARDDGVRVLIAAIDREPGHGRELVVEGNAAALDLAEILAHEQDRR